MLISHGRAENVTEPERIDGNGVADHGDEGDWCRHVSHQSETLHVPAAATSMTVNRLLRNTTGKPGIGGHSATGHVPGDVAAREREQTPFGHWK